MAEVLTSQQSGAGGAKPAGRRVNNRGVFRAEGVQGGFDPQQNVTLSRKSEIAVKQKKQEQKEKKGGCCK